MDIVAQCRAHAPNARYKWFAGAMATHFQTPVLEACLVRMFYCVLPSALQNRVTPGFLFFCNLTVFVVWISIGFD